VFEGSEVGGKDGDGVGMSDGTVVGSGVVLLVIFPNG